MTGSEGNVSAVVTDSQSWLLWVHWDIFAQKFPVLYKVTLPEPSTFTAYWSNWRTSMTEPVMSHLVGSWPVLF